MGRLPASERRAAVLDKAMLVFSRSGYRGATQAWERAVAAEGDPQARMSAMAGAFFEFKERRSAAADVVRRCQAAGAVPADRDARAEAWVFIAIGLLTAVAGRLGGLPPNDLERIRAERRRWLVGT